MSDHACQFNDKSNDAKCIHCELTMSGQPIKPDEKLPTSNRADFGEDYDDLEDERLNDKAEEFIEEFIEGLDYDDEKINKKLKKDKKNT